MYRSTFSRNKSKQIILHGTKINFQQNNLHPSGISQKQIPVRTELMSEHKILYNYIYNLMLPEQKYINNLAEVYDRPPLWSSGQSSWLQIQGSRVPFPDTTKKTSESGTGSTQPREYN
jgi:hypothetical protein